MPSPALIGWQSTRRSRIDELFAAHRQVSGVGRGRRWNTGQLNAALAVRLAAEFQGYARELNDLAWDSVLASTAQYKVPAVEALVRTQLTAGRKLDTGNATPSNIAQDFGRLGILKLWDTLKTVNPRAKEWQETLELLNTARNGFAHGDEVKIVKLKQDGHSINQQKIKSWLGDLDKLATLLDDVIYRYLLNLTGVPPW